MIKNTERVIYGDFQTPPYLAQLMTDILFESPFKPEIIVEPTCGVGEILIAAHTKFNPSKSIGVEINSEYVSISKSKLTHFENTTIVNADIFSYLEILSNSLADYNNFLFIGNPPWVTNSGLGAINSNNLPTKSNIKGLKGIEAITGKSNFDLGEFILWKLISQFNNKKSVFAFLCKTIVARNLLKSIWEKQINYGHASIYPIDSKKHFDASVDACFFVIDFTTKSTNQTCSIFDSIESKKFVSRYGFFSKMIINNYDSFKSHNYFGKSDYTWRNGIKHDCSKVMELESNGNGYTNGLGEFVDIEPDIIYPLLKSSDLAKESIQFRKYVIVTQKTVGEDTSYIHHKLPKTWAYLQKHTDLFNDRKSSIYCNKPSFSIFSIGDYAFSPFKIAISGLYKNITFHILTSMNEKPIMVDDTCNYISCYSEDEAKLIYLLLTSNEAKLYLKSVIFWDSKRPITTDILNHIDLLKISVKLGLEELYFSYISMNKTTENHKYLQLALF